MKRFISFTLLLVIMFLLHSCNKDNTSNVAISSDSISLSNPIKWIISGTPARFPESNYINSSTNNLNRAQIAWYIIDDLFYRNNSYTPAGITTEMLSDLRMREVHVTEILKNTQLPVGASATLRMFDMDYYPTQKGPYNFETTNTTYSPGLNYDGDLINPESRWAGIQTFIKNNSIDFTRIQFWLMDPFTGQSNINGNLYINLGDMNEYIVENQINSSNNYGLDGMIDSTEHSFYNNYILALQQLQTSNKLSGLAFNKFNSDPSQDNYISPTDPVFSSETLIDRYSKAGGTEKNNLGYPSSGDFNGNGILDTVNNYNEYLVSIHPGDFIKGTNYIDDVRESVVKLRNGCSANIKWYHFNIPLSSTHSSYGSWSGNKSNISLRMYLTGFSYPVHLRLSGLSLNK
jgi:hypothetical protein